MPARAPRPAGTLAPAYPTRQQAVGTRWNAVLHGGRPSDHDHPFLGCPRRRGGQVATMAVRLHFGLCSLVLLLLLLLLVRLLDALLPFALGLGQLLPEKLVDGEAAVALLPLDEALDEAWKDTPDLAIQRVRQEHQAAQGEDDHAAEEQARKDDAPVLRKRGDLHQDAKHRWDRLSVVGPVNVPDTFHHEGSHHDQRRPGGQCWDGGKERGEEHSGEVEDRDHHSCQACASALVHTDHRLAVRGHRASAQEAADQGTDGIRHECAVGAREVVRLGRVDQSAQVGGGVEQAQGAEEVDVQEPEQRGPEVLHREIAGVKCKECASVDVPRALLVNAALFVPAEGLVEAGERLDEVAGQAHTRESHDGRRMPEGPWDSSCAANAALSEGIYVEGPGWSRGRR
mmetsp:Transcript_55846/g.166092  ORF Transcript_55846/g.166092 Transcript_55846/m.166092 type:complete len:399 (+) Transcript_55846:105-1301(+)